jgi:hypothetical protein
MAEKTYRITIVWPEDEGDQRSRQVHYGCTLESISPTSISFCDNEGVFHRTNLSYEVKEEPNHDTKDS